MNFARDTLGQHLHFANGKTSPERTEHGAYAVFGSNGEIGRSDQKNSPAQTTVIGRVGSYCGSVHYSPEACWVTDNAIKATAKVPEEGRFWFFALANQNLHDLRAGSGQPLINQTSLKAVELPVPATDDRPRIGALLGALDDKIELNRRMNGTLEEMARALFRDWFVDFGPTRRQIDGATDPAAIMGHAFPPEKAANLAPLFPATLGDDGLPEGWETQRIEHALDRLKVGKLYNQKTALNEGKVPILDQGKFGVIGYHYNEPNIVASVEHRVGIFANHTCVQRLLDHPFSTIQNVIPYRGKELPTEWCHYATLGQQAFEEYKGHWPTFVSKEIIKPKPEPAIAFSEFVDAMLLKASANEQENQTLAEMRDLLLPKLMSGEVRLKDTEAVS